MREDLPASHVQEAMKLEARGYVELLRIDLRPPGLSTLSLYLSPNQQIEWQGVTWQEWPWTIGESGSASSGEVTRPKLSIANIDYVWSRYIHQKYAENAIVKRYRILRPDIETNTNAFVLASWRWSKTMSLNKDLVVGELRTALDGHSFRIPSETYRPPKYPTVSVQ